MMKSYVQMQRLREVQIVTKPLIASASIYPAPNATVDASR